MKVVIDQSIPDLTEEEKEEATENARDVESDPEAFKRDMQGLLSDPDFTLVMSPEVAAQMEEAGLTPEVLMAMIAKSAGLQQ